MQGSSVLDLPSSDLLQARTHNRKLFGRMPDPIYEFTNDTQRIAATERLRGIPGELLVGHVRVIFELARRFDEIDTPGILTDCKFGSPCGGVEGGCEVDVIHLPALFKVGLPTRDQQVPGNELCLGAMQEGAGRINLKGHRCVFAVHDGNATFASPTAGTETVIDWG